MPSPGADSACVRGAAQSDVYGMSILGLVNAWPARILMSYGSSRRLGSGSVAFQATPRLREELVLHAAIFGTWPRSGPADVDSFEKYRFDFLNRSWNRAEGPKRRRTEADPYLHPVGVCDFCDSLRGRDQELLLDDNQLSPSSLGPARTQIDFDIESTVDLLGMDDAKFPVTPDAKRARSGDNTPEKERPASREVESVLNALPKGQHALGQLMMLLNTKVDNYAMQMMDRQKESEH